MYVNEVESRYPDEFIKHFLLILESIIRNTDEGYGRFGDTILHVKIDTMNQEEFDKKGKKRNE